MHFGRILTCLGKIVETDLNVEPDAWTARFLF